MVNLSALLNLTRPLLIFDLETTSTDPETARICQYAHRIHRPGEAGVGYHTLVDPLVEISDDNAEVHGITNAIIQFGCAKCRKTKEEHIVCPHHPLKEVECAFCQSCPEWRQIPTFQQIGTSIQRGFAGCDLSGYNVRFDINVTEKQLERECGLKLNLDDVRIIDPHRIWQHMMPRNLSSAYEEFTGKTATNAHDAMFDVEMTEEALIGQLERWADKLPDNVPQLHTILWPDNIDYEGKFVFNKHGEPCLGFGKHKGQPMRLCMDYLKWMNRQGGWSSGVRKIIEEALKGKFPVRP